MIITDSELRLPQFIVLHHSEKNFNLRRVYFDVAPCLSCTCIQSWKKGKQIQGVVSRELCKGRYFTCEYFQRAN